MAVTFYCNNTGSKPYYTCEVTYDEATRNGTTVTLPNVHLVMTRKENTYTTNRLAYRVGTTTNGSDIVANGTINSWNTHSAASYNINIGDITYSDCLDTTVHLYVAVASTGGNSGWTHFQGNSPVTVIDADISCPAANPTFTTNPTLTKWTSETSLRLTAGETDIASKMYYRISTTSGGGSWVSMGDSSSVTITGLTANTLYYVTVQARNADDETLTTNSSELSTRTYANPSVQSWPASFNMSDSSVSLTFVLNNPLYRSFTIQAYANNSKVQEWGNITTYGLVRLSLSCSEVYRKIPNSTSATMYFRAIANGITTQSSNITAYAVEALVRPRVKTAGFLWQAMHPSAFSSWYTNTSKMIQNKSYIQVKYDSNLNNIGDGIEGATIASAAIKIGTQNSQSLTNSYATYISTSTTFNSTATENAIITITDSRGYTNTATVSIPFIAYTTPVAAITATREGGYGSNVVLNLSGTCSSLDNTNSIQSLKWKAGSEGSWTSATVSSGTATVATTLSSNATQTYYCKATDRAGTESAAVSFSLGVGDPLLFIDTDYKSIGINCMAPTVNKKVQINGALDIGGATSITGNASISGIITTNTLKTSTISKDSGNITLNNQLLGTKAGQWNKDRDNALIRNNNTNTGAYGPAVSVKTYAGTWSIGTLPASDQNNQLLFNYVTDSDYTTNNNTSAKYSLPQLDAGSYHIAVLEKIYPVGALWISTINTNPSTLLGFGTWNRIKNAYLFASNNADNSSTQTGTITGGTGKGAQGHQLSIDEIPVHKHDTWKRQEDAPSNPTYTHMVDLYGTGPTTYGWQPTVTKYTDRTRMETGDAGGGGEHTHDIATLEVYVWVRAS